MAYLSFLVSAGMRRTLSPCGHIQLLSLGGRNRPSAQLMLPVLNQTRLWADMVALLRQDLANVENGIYPLPSDHDGSLAELVNRSILFLRIYPPSIVAGERSTQRIAHSANTVEATSLFSPKVSLPN